MSKKNPELYMVRGSGYAIDGAAVTLGDRHEVDGEVYFSVQPAAPRLVGSKSLLVHERYLEPIEKRLKRYTYTFTVSKKCEDDATMEQDFLVIDSAFRNMQIRSILARIDSELGPILRLE